MDMTPDDLEFLRFLKSTMVPQDPRALPAQQAKHTVKTELRLADTLRQLHGYWKSKVFQAISSLEEVTNVVDVSKLDKRQAPTEKDFESPKMLSFKLGQRVKIVGEDRRFFKTVQKKVGKWREGLTDLIGKEAIVMNLSSFFVIGVSLVDDGEMAHLHGFLLQAVENRSEEGIWKNKTRFKKDDEVVIGVDNFTLFQLQRNARKTPYNIALQLNSYIGRIVCFFRGEVVVTFDEKRHELFHPDALKAYDDRDKGKQKMVTHGTDKDIRLQTKGTVISELLQVMNLQRGHGEWNYKMSRFIGKEGTVVDITPDKDLVIKFSPFESFIMNRETVNFDRKKQRTRHKSGNEPILFAQAPFMMGDVVRFKATADDLMSNLHLLRIPAEFVTIISDCMEFVGYVDKKTGVVDIGDGAEYIVELDLLIKAGQPLWDNFKNRLKSDRAIEVGKKVTIFVGPRNFVKACIGAERFDKRLETALEQTAVVEGYDDQAKAIIRYPDGKLFKISDEYLCTPRDLWSKVNEGSARYLAWSKRSTRISLGVEVHLLGRITDTLRSMGVENMLNWWSSVNEKKENCSTVEIRLMSVAVDKDIFLQELSKLYKTHGLESELKEDGTLVVKLGIRTFEMTFLFETQSSIRSEHDEIRDVPEIEDSLDDRQTPLPNPSAELQEAASSPAPALGALGRSLSVTEVSTETGIPTDTDVPFRRDQYAVSIPAGVNQVVLQFGSNAHAAPQRQRNPRPNVTPRGGVMMNPAAPTIINMYGDGENRVQINDSYIGSIQNQ